jgi:hypothetical protein
MVASRTLLAGLVLGITVLAHPAMPQEAAKPFKPEELDQLVAPIALHPDSLLAQVLMASTYPLEVVQAARFVDANPKLQGDPLNEALKQQSWDDSVKSLVFFPQVLAMMNEKLDWLQKLGDAVLAQQPDVLAAVQRLRARAQSSGQLKSTAEQKVLVEPSAAPSIPPPPPGAPPPPPAGAATTTVEVTQAPATVIRIEPASPQTVYVPSYDPMVVYGAWPPAYPPYYPYPAGYFAAGAFTFAAGVTVGAALWGDCDWGHGDIDIDHSSVNNFTRNVNRETEASKRVENYSRGSGSGAAGQNRGSWQHDTEHRQGVQYRDAATQQRYNRTGPANAQSREAFRGRSGQAPAGGPAQPGGLQAGTRERPGAAGQQPGGSIADRGAQASPRTGDVGQGRQAGAFEGVGNGRDAQSFSQRGNASRQSYDRSTGGASRTGAGAGGVRGGGGRGGGGRR